MPVVVTPSPSQKTAPLLMTAILAVGLALGAWLLLALASPSQPVVWRVAAAGVPALLATLAGLSAVERVRLSADEDGLVIVNLTSTRRLAWSQIVAIDASYWGAGLLIRTTDGLAGATAPGDGRWHDPQVVDLLGLAARHGVRVKGLHVAAVDQPSSHADRRTA